ncbi:hypothetical protein HXX76_009992 [Chlamydomonas incerta]|uniref:Uncharacterized protein n=1 Tax=Chlamydomonas incerta TaxID=51695 RepID=A0A835VYN4_CHLIN|nr:hypothetical protein HXX76_009992 [Chlamydomonas incerta]|eukprot:KAG2430469.1 hypothetical protein HXX76_009992 [Chlamydomonas incerta]
MEAAASTSGREASAPGWIGRELKPGKKKEPPLAWMYLREAPDGTKTLMPWSERLIWGSVLGGIAYFFGPRIYNARKKAAEEEEASKVREAELKTRRLTAIRVLLSNKDWLGPDADAFEGLSPKQIAEFMKEHGINAEDPFEGMSPEEIDEFVAKTGMQI